MGRGFSKRWFYFKSLFRKSRKSDDDEGGRRVQNIKKSMTSFMNDPQRKESCSLCSHDTNIFKFFHSTLKNSVKFIFFIQFLFFINFAELFNLIWIHFLYIINLLLGSLDFEKKAVWFDLILTYFLDILSVLYHKTKPIIAISYRN